MRKQMSRRRFLSVCAMSAAFSAVPWAQALAAVPLHRWKGILLGAEVHLTLAHPDKKYAHKVFDLCVQEIKRLENIFTLYDSHSELSRLNREGILNTPSREMHDILMHAKTYHGVTGGAFDITVQPLWKLHLLEKPAEQDIRKTLDCVGMEKLRISKSRIGFEKAGMGLTLNGIAQGYITDRITELLRAEGLKNVLVELGEKRALGRHPAGRPWRLGIQGGRHVVDLQDDKALATSSPVNKIYDPRTGGAAGRYKQVSVLADNALKADALSTAFLCMPRGQIRELVSSRFKDVEVYF